MDYTVTIRPASDEPETRNINHTFGTLQEAIDAYSVEWFRYEDEGYTVKGESRSDGSRFFTARRKGCRHGAVVNLWLPTA